MSTQVMTECMDFFYHGLGVQGNSSASRGKVSPRAGLHIKKFKFNGCQGERPNSGGNKIPAFRGVLRYAIP